VVRTGKSSVPKKQRSLEHKTPGSILSVDADEAGFTFKIALKPTVDVRGFALEGPNTTVTGRVIEDYRGIATVRFPNTATVWGRKDVPLSSGNYYLRADLAKKTQSKDFWIDGELAAKLPAEQLTEAHRVTVRSRNDYSRSYPVVQLDAPKAVEDRGWRNHQRLIDKYAQTPPSHEGFFLRSLYGEVANCNGKGLHEEINRQGLDVPVYWSVKDTSVGVPPGGIPVVEGTEDWHRAIRAARNVLVNVHQHPWYKKVEGQRLIETFHGYPYKLMGHDWWDFHNFPVRQVEEFDRRARDWDYVVSPATYARPLLSAAFLEPAGSKAKLLDIGYPRNDVLLRADDLAVLRSATRDLLQIDERTTAVLYAPTFRDYLSDDDMTADFVDLLDAGLLAERLGEEYVLLMRGHPFNARGSKAPKMGSAKIVDVTTYPDINDLFAASDAAILDYSSARFDYMLTRKPAVFFVPDAVMYHDNRPGLLEYRETAPGPLLSRMGEVAAVLRDLPKLNRDYADQREEFLKTYADLDDGYAGERLLSTLKQVPTEQGKL
jgi:CDP-glycerol glycerophosphotransferase